jgi:ATP-binding cassette, subfamily C (CFTR/MRP), member 1
MTTFWNDEGSSPSGGSSHGEEGMLTEEKIDVLGEKLTRKKSFGRAVVASVTSQTTKASSGGLSEEHSAQGRVKARVYWSYIEAVSKTGFASATIVAILQQALQIISTFALKNWSEGNRESGENKSAMKYLWAYGVLSLASMTLSYVGSILMLVLCSLRGSKYLHDSVRWLVFPHVVISDSVWDRCSTRLFAPR